MSLVICCYLCQVPWRRGLQLLSDHRSGPVLLRILGRLQCRGARLPVHHLTHLHALQPVHRRALPCEYSLADGWKSTCFIYSYILYCTTLYSYLSIVYFIFQFWSVSGGNGVPLVLSDVQGEFGGDVRTFRFFHQKNAKRHIFHPKKH